MLACGPLFLLLVLVAPILMGLVYFQAIKFSFGRLGLSPEGASLLLIAALIGSMINIPISRRPILVEPTVHPFWRYFFYYPPRVAEQVIAVNVGGAVIPVLFSLYLLPGAPLIPTLVATLVVTVVCKAVARVTPGVGITMPTFVAPFAAIGSAVLLAPAEAPRVAFIGGSLGVLIGADLLNLRAIRQMPALMLSIGGAGVFDGIFLVGILAALLT